MNEIIANLSVEALAGMIDHTFLKPYGTEENIYQAFKQFVGKHTVGDFYTKTSGNNTERF